MKGKLKQSGNYSPSKSSVVFLLSTKKIFILKKPFEEKYDKNNIEEVFSIANVESISSFEGQQSFDSVFAIVLKDGTKFIGFEKSTERRDIILYELSRLYSKMFNGTMPKYLKLNSFENLSKEKLAKTSCIQICASVYLLKARLPFCLTFLSCVCPLLIS